jgi:transporter family-2 protein
MQYWPVGFALFAAAMLPVQAACNAAMNRALGHPTITILISMLVSILSVSLVTLVTGRFANIPVDRFGIVPWWAWSAGLGGAFYVSSQPFVIPRLGAALFTSLIVTGQVVMAMALDHFGALQLPPHPASPLRVLGAVLIVAGMALVARF